MHFIAAVAEAKATAAAVVVEAMVVVEVAAMFGGVVVLMVERLVLSAFLDHSYLALVGGAGVSSCPLMLSHDDDSYRP